MEKTTLDAVKCIKKFFLMLLLQRLQIETNNQTIF